VLVELSVVEQRYHAVMEVAAGVPVTQVAARYGVSRQSVHSWVRKYEQSGLPGLADRSHRPDSCPHRIAGEVEALVCELRDPPCFGRLKVEREADPQRTCEAWPTPLLNRSVDRAARITIRPNDL
jgi:transposase